jgi:hypothetical protein
MENSLGFLKILKDAISVGTLHRTELLAMYHSCAFPEEVRSGSLKIFSKRMNELSSSSFDKSSSNFNK